MRSDNEDIVRELARFLVIRSCGFLEQVSTECCKYYIRQKSDPRSSSFASSWLERTRNPSPENLIDLVRRFDPAWSDELRQVLDEDDERLRREASFLVDRRNRIAHGENERVSARKAIDLCEVSQEITDWFLQRFDPA